MLSKTLSQFFPFVFYALFIILLNTELISWQKRDFTNLPIQHTNVICIFCEDLPDIWEIYFYVYVNVLDLTENQHPPEFILGLVRLALKKRLSIYSQ